MKLLLTSAGVSESFKDTFLTLLDKDPKNTSVLCVNTASYGEKSDKSWIENLGITAIEDLDIRGKTEDELRTIVSEKDILLVNGGNTFFLMKYVKETGFDKVIKEHVGKNKLYMGISAGSYICCPTIEHAHWKHADRNRVDLKDLTGLNLVPFFVVAHFAEDVRGEVEEKSKNVTLQVVALSDTQAVLVENSSVKVIGEGKKEFFNGFLEK